MEDRNKTVCMNTGEHPSEDRKLDNEQPETVEDNNSAQLNVSGKYEHTDELSQKLVEDTSEVKTPLKGTSRNKSKTLAKVSSNYISVKSVLLLYSGRNQLLLNKSVRISRNLKKMEEIIKDKQRYLNRLTEELKAGVPLSPTHSTLSDREEREVFLKLLKNIQKNAYVESFAVVGPFLQLCSPMIVNTQEPLHQILSNCTWHLEGLLTKYASELDNNKENQPPKDEVQSSPSLSFQDCIQKLSERSILQI